MSRYLWENVKKSKGFYVNLYRKTLVLLLFSLFLNVSLLIVIWLIHMTEPERSYYATDGITAPMLLSPMLHPNDSATALLPSGPETDNNELIKVIPP